MRGLAPAGIIIPVTSTRFESGTNKYYVGFLRYGQDGVTRLTSDTLQSSSQPEQRFPVASPDYSQVAYVEQGFGNNNIMVVSAPGGGDETKIYDDDDPGMVGSPEQVVWKPDGSGLLFVTFSKSIYSIDADGSNLTTLYSDPSNRTVANISYNYDGTRISFQVLLSSTSRGNWVMDADGTNASQLSTTPTQFSGIIDNRPRFFWAQTQNKLAYVGNTLASPTARVINDDGTGDTLLGSLENAAYLDQGCWFPDDDYVLYRASTSQDIRKFASDGSGNSMVYDGTGGYNNQRIVDQRIYVELGDDIYSMALDGTDYTNHTGSTTENIGLL